MSYTTWDTETTITSRFKRKATPFGGLNWVVTHAFKNKGGAVQEHRFGQHPPGSGWLRPVLQGTRLLVGFNIKFDLLHALQDADNLEAWMAYVAAGGNVWDCQLAEYLLNGMGQRDHMLSLDEVAPRYGGSLKVDEVKALWAAGVNTCDIEPSLLTRYLCGGNDEHGQWQPGDVENTERVALAQIERARQAGQLKSILLNMGSLLCSIEMERNGMFVDKARGLVLAEEMRQEVERLRLALEAHMPGDMPTGLSFNWNSRFHKSALIFGGTVKYPRREYQLIDGSFTFEQDHDEQVYVQKDELHWVLTSGDTTDVPPHKSDVCGGDYATFKGGKNAGEYKTKKVKVDDLTKPKSRMGTDTYTFPGFTAPRREWESSEPGVWSTASEVIKALEHSGVPFLKAFAQLQALAKDLGTYFIVTDEETGESTGMLSLVDEHGLIHHRINHTSTVTGRFSSSDPNLQNIPKGNKSQVKTLFVSRFGADGKVIQSDFTALEIYVQAVLSGCRQLIADLWLGLDLHVMRLATKERMPYEEVFKLCKGDKATGAAPVPEWDYKRTGAKVFSFQRAYGAGAQKISDSTGIPLEEVEALILAEEERYPEITEYAEAISASLKANRRPAGIAVPHPTVPGIMCNLGVAHYRTPDGKLYSYQEQPAPEFVVKRGTFANFSPTEIKNYVVQGTGGEWAKAAMWLAIRAFYARRNFEHRALIVNQVHDAVYADAHQDVAADAAALLHACMEGASDFMEWYFNWEIPVPVPSDTTWGASMMDENPVPQVKENAQQLRKELRALYMGGFTPSFAAKQGTA